MARVVVIGSGPAGVSAALYARRGGAEVTVSNCFVNASINLKFQDNSSKIITRNNAVVDNCYYAGELGNAQNFMANDRNTPQATEATAERTTIRATVTGSTSAIR